MRSFFGPRTVVEAAFLVAVPVIALEVGLRWDLIVVAGGIAYLLAIGVEAAVWRDSERGARTPAAVASGSPTVGADQRVRVIRTEPEPAAAPAPVPAAAVIRSGGPRQWNVWDLERVAREHAGGDPVADEERTFLLMYLRDFAGADGLLPADFDDLVRQSFGGLVANL
jgi:hypothetical protein